MVCPKLPSDIWKHIRSFSGDTAYDTTPSARVIQSLTFYDDSSGRYAFRFGADGYASTILTISDGYFRKAMSKCRDEFCSTCNIRDWSCVNALPNRIKPRQLLRLIHQDSDGYLIRALK